MSFLEAIFIDPLTARFALFYLPALGVLIAISVAFPSRPDRPKAERLSKDSRNARVAQFGRSILDRVARLDVTPNQITWVGLLLVSANAALYLYHQNSFWFGFALIFSYLFDALDGLVARAQGTVSRFGGFLDAVLDRYQEVVTCFAVGIVTGWWILIFFVITGSMLTSYNKARVAIEMPVDNKGWPDLLIRHRRLWLVSFALIGDICVPWLLYFVLLSLAVMAHFTAVQRYFRARAMLSALDRTAIVQPS